MKKIVKEQAPPMSGPNMVRHDDFISAHAADGHAHHKTHFSKHAEGHQFEMDKVAALHKR